MKAPDPLVISWQGRQVRVRHDDPHLGPYTPRGAVIRSAMELASDVEGLRLYLVTALGDRYQVRAADDGSVIGLSQRKRPASERRTGLSKMLDVPQVRRAPGRSLRDPSAVRCFPCGAPMPTVSASALRVPPATTSQVSTHTARAHQEA